MNLFGKNKKDTGESSSSPVVSEKTKQSAGFLKRSVNKIGDILNKKFGSTKHTTDTESMSNTEYLGEIYKLMVQNHDDSKLEREKETNRREEEDSEDQKRHSEIIKALTLRRRPKPKRVAKREKKAEEKAKKKEEPAKKEETPKKTEEAPKKTEEAPKKTEDVKKKAEEEAKKSAEEKTKKAAEEKAKKEAEDAAKKSAEEKVKKEAEEKAKKAAEEKAKRETAERLKKEEQERLKREAEQKAAANKPSAEPVKPPEPLKPTQPVKPPSGVKPPPSATKIPKGMSSAVGPVIAALTAAGITNVYAQRALLANVEKETGGTKLEEDILRYKNTSNDRIREIFTTRVKNLSDKELDEVKKDPYKFGELVYGKNTDIGKKMGNTEEGDGYKYRGRGYIQLTGKNAYRDYSKVAGIDLVKNPDALLQPDIAAKVAAEYIKRTGGKKGLEFSNQQEANRAITQAIGGSKLNLDKGYGAELLNKVEKNSKNYSDVGTGTKIDQTSRDNTDMKKQDEPAPVTIQQNTTNVNNTSTAPAAPTVNDRPKHDRK